MKIKEINFLNKEEKLVLELCKKYKMSVSGVKYSRGHDGKCMECNLKIGNKIKAIVWDDSWGGEYDYQRHNSTEALNEALEVLNKVSNEAPTYKFIDMDMKFSMDLIVSLLVSQFSFEKTCKKKTVIIAVKSENYNPEDTSGKGISPKLEMLKYSTPFNTNGVDTDKIKEDLAKDGYTHFEIINKRFVARNVG